MKKTWTQGKPALHFEAIPVAAVKEITQPARPHLNADKTRMLDLITTHREAIVTCSRQKVARRYWPPVSTEEIEHGVPLLVAQLTDILKNETAASPAACHAIGGSAVRHVRALRDLRLSLPQVVHDYGDICQAITEIAIEQQVSIAFEEFQTLNRCLETAVAEATASNALHKFPAPAGERRAGLNL